MLRNVLSAFRNFFRGKSRSGEIAPDEIFLDAANLPSLDEQQFEGRFEKPISNKAMFGLVVSFLVVFLVFISRASFLQVIKGSAYRERSENNHLRNIPVFAERGQIVDRNGVTLASGGADRKYIKISGLSHLLGYVGLPSELDLAAENSYSEEPIGKAGIEKIFNKELRGVPGLKVAEVDVKGVLQSENVFRPPVDSKNVTLSVDSLIQNKLFETIKSLAKERGFTGGAGVIMDVYTGEVLAMASYPEYDSNVMTLGDDNDLINQYIRDPGKPFLNRAISGLYTPGSIVKPIMAIAALTEKVITPEKKILSTGSISIVNPYDKTQKTVFNDWKAHGWVDMRQAIAVSSNIYFYEVGGGYENQKGIGIAKIEQYANMFGLGEKTGIEIEGEGVGLVPSPAWKLENFKGEPWRIGDTYHTSIGQYGFQVTALQMARAIGGIATGRLVQPTILKRDLPIPISVRDIVADESSLKVVREGMRMAVNTGSAGGLNIAQVAVAAKTGTAELGISKANVNSWVEGFFPYEHPRYSFSVVMESGKRANTIGGVYVMRQLLDWMSLYSSSYLTSGLR